MTTSLRRVPKALAIISSDCPPAYMSAVSKKLTPASRARPMIAFASCCPIFHTAPKSSVPEPNVITPRARRETTRPLFPRRLYCMKFPPRVYELRRARRSPGFKMWRMGGIDNDLADSGIFRNILDVRSTCPRVLPSESYTLLCSQRGNRRQQVYCSLTDRQLGHD